MADPNNDTLAKIQQYAAESKALQDREMDIDSSDMEVRLEHTIKELEGRVQQQQAALEKVRGPLHHPIKQYLQYLVHQLTVISSAKPPKTPSAQPHPHLPTKS